MYIYWHLLRSLTCIGLRPQKYKHIYSSMVEAYSAVIVCKQKSAGMRYRLGDFKYVSICKTIYFIACTVIVSVSNSGNFSNICGRQTIV